jgi:hypothetical protein
MNTYPVPPLLENGSADSAAVHWPGGRGFFVIVGTFGSTSAQLEYLGPDSSTWLAYQVLDPADGSFASVALTAAGGFVFELPATQIRVNLTGGTPSALYARAARIPS